MSMKIRTTGVLIRVEPLESVVHDAFDTLKKIKLGEKIDPEPKTIVFPDLQTLRSMLTDERIRLLSVIQSKKPDSVQALAKLSKRKYANVFMDVKKLESLGLVKLAKETNKSRPVSRYRELNIKIPLTAKATP